MGRQKMKSSPDHTDIVLILSFITAIAAADYDYKKDNLNNNSKVTYIFLALIGCAILYALYKKFCIDRNQHHEQHRRHLLADSQLPAVPPLVTSERNNINELKPERSSTPNVRTSLLPADYQQKKRPSTSPPQSKFFEAVVETRKLHQRSHSADAPGSSRTLSPLP